MAAIKPLFRVTLSTLSATILTPRAGAAHTDTFQVTTQVNPSAPWKPYLLAPSGRWGKFDRMNCHAELGQVDFEVADIKLTNNATRWVTAFLADTAGNPQFKGLVAKIEISLNAGGAWTTWFSGRVVNVQAPDPASNGPKYRFTIYDARVEVSRPAFVSMPHRSVIAGTFDPAASTPTNSAVRYAKPARLWPAGLEGWTSVTDTLGWGGLTATPPAKGTIQTPDDAQFGSGAMVFNLDFDYTGINRQHILEHRLVLTDALAQSVKRGMNAKIAGVEQPPMYPDARARLYNASKVLIGHFHLTPVKQKSGVSYNDEQYSPIWLNADPKHPSVLTIGLMPLPSTHPLYAALPSAATAVWCDIYRSGEPTPDAPLLIDNAHPATLAQDLLAAKFSDLFYDTDAALLLNDAPSGEARWTPVATDATSFTALLNNTVNPTFPPLQKLAFMIAAPEKDLGKFLDEQVCKVTHIGMQIRGDMTVYGADLRAPVSSAGLITIDSTLSGSADWRGGEDAYPLVIVQHQEYWEDQTAADQLIASVIPQINATLLASKKTATREAYGDTANVATVGPQPYPTTIDARGLPRISKYALQPYDKPSGRVPIWLLVAQPYQQIYGRGAMYLDLNQCRRVVGTTDSIWPCQWVVVNVPEQPNASTVTRGGSRVMLCVARQDDTQTGAIKFTFLDSGLGVQAVAPTLGTVIVNAGDPSHAIDIPVTLNGTSERVQVDINITSTGVGARPADSDGGWRPITTVGTTSTVTTRGLPANSRIWVRASSVPALKFPSAYAYASTFIDLTVIAAPSALVTANITQSTVDFSWTNNDTKNWIEVLVQGVVVMRLPPGTTFVTLYELATTNGVVVSLGVRAADGVGGFSTTTSTSITTTVTVPTAPTVAGIAPITVSAGPGLNDPGKTVSAGCAFGLYANAIAKVFDFKIERCADNAGAPNPGAGLTTLQGASAGSETYVDPLPLDNTPRWYRIRHTRTGYADGTPTDWRKAIPGVVPAQLIRPAPVMPMPLSSTGFTTDASGFVITGTAQVKVYDPQSRISAMAFALAPGSAFGAFVPIAATSFDYATSTAQYDTYVNLDGNLPSKIAYQLTGFDDHGFNNKLAQDEFSYPIGGAAAPIGGTSSFGPPGAVALVFDGSKRSILHFWANGVSKSYRAAATAGGPVSDTTMSAAAYVAIGSTAVEIATATLDAGGANDELVYARLWLYNSTDGTGSHSDITVTARRPFLASIVRPTIKDVLVVPNKSGQGADVWFSVYHPTPLGGTIKLWLTGNPDPDRSDAIPTGTPDATLAVTAGQMPYPVKPPDLFTTSGGPKAVLTDVRVSSWYYPRLIYAEFVDTLSVSSGKIPIGIIAQRINPGPIGEPNQPQLNATTNVFAAYASSPLARFSSISATVSPTTIAAGRPFSAGLTVLPSNGTDVWQVEVKFTDGAGALVGDAYYSDPITGGISSRIAMRGYVPAAGAVYVYMAIQPLGAVSGTVSGTNPVLNEGDTPLASSGSVTSQRQTTQATDTAAAAAQAAVREANARIGEGGSGPGAADTTTSVPMTDFTGLQVLIDTKLRQIQTALTLLQGVQIQDAVDLTLRNVENIRDAAIKDAIASAVAAAGVVFEAAAREGFSNTAGQRIAGANVTDSTGLLVILDVAARVLKNFFYLSEPAAVEYMALGRDVAATRPGLWFTNSGVGAQFGAGDFARLQTDGSGKAIGMTLGQWFYKRFDAGTFGATGTIDWVNGNNQRCLLSTANCTLTLNNPIAGAVYRLEIKQDATTARTVTWPASVKWAGGVAPVQTATLGRVDRYQLEWTGTDYIGSFVQNYAIT